jgi:hypothetical protein
MKRAMIGALAVAICAAGVVAVAGDKRETGLVDGNRYVDQQYGFVFNKLDNWKYGKIDKENPAEARWIRFTLTQKNYFIPPERRATQESFIPPTLAVWVDTTSLSPEAYAAALTDSKNKEPWRKAFGQTFVIVGRGRAGESGKVQIDGRDGVMQQYRLDYDAQNYDRSRDKYTMISEARLSDLYVVKMGNRVYAFVFEAERATYPSVREESRTMIMSADFDPPADTSAAGAQ